MIVKSLQTKRGAREGFGLVIAVKHETDVLYYYIIHLTFAIPFNWIEVHIFFYLCLPAPPHWPLITKFGMAQIGRAQSTQSLRK